MHAFEVDLPSDVRDLIEEYEVVRSTTGAGGAGVFRLRAPPGKPDLFLKLGSGPIALEIAEEMVRLDWLRAHLPTPPVRYFRRAAGSAWMLTDAFDGVSIADAVAARPCEAAAIVAAAGGFLRRLHAIPVARCPFVGDLAHRLASAEGRIADGLVDESDFDDGRIGWSARQVLDAITAMPPLPADAVVAHGDFTVDNLLIDGTTVSGCIDVGRLGVADRYQDIALFWRDLGDFDARLREVFVSAYGLDRLDVARRDVHLMLDELF